MSLNRLYIKNITNKNNESQINYKEIKKKKNKSVNKKSILDTKKENLNDNKIKIKNINNNEESEDSGDSFGIDNNSD